MIENFRIRRLRENISANDREIRALKQAIQRMEESNARYRGEIKELTR